MAGLSLNTFCQLAVIVTTRSHASGMPGTHTHLSLPCLSSRVTHSVRAMAASSWLAMPNSGKSWLMPPRGSLMPM